MSEAHESLENAFPWRQMDLPNSVSRRVTLPGQKFLMFSTTKSSLYTIKFVKISVKFSNAKIIREFKYIASSSSMTTISYSIYSSNREPRWPAHAEP